MADEINEDSWLYGTDKSEAKAVPEADNENTEKEDTIPESQETPPENEETKQDESELEKPSNVEEDPAEDMEEQEQQPENNTEDQNGINGDDAEEEKEDSDEDSDDDDINIVIGRIKTGPLYPPKQRQNFVMTNVGSAAEKKNSGKFNIEEFESIGTINGVPTHEFSIDSLDEKPWRKPGADITDYFNYGFNEETWRAYCERQKRIRINESGVGLQSLTVAQTGVQNNNINPYTPQQHQTPQVISNDFSTNRTLTSLSNPNKYVPPAKPRVGYAQNNVARENPIQVMTAECRDYSKMNFGGMHEEPSFNADMYGYGFEPTQDVQWANQMRKHWQPVGIKELTQDPTQMQLPINPVFPPNMGNQMLENNTEFDIKPNPPIPRNPEAIMLPPPKASYPYNREWNKDWEQERNHMNDKERSSRNRDREQRDYRSRENKERESYEKEKNDRSWKEKERSERRKSRDRSRERQREKSADTDKSVDESREKRRRERERERERDKERSSRRERSRSRDRSRRRSRSHDKSYERKEKKDKKKSKEKSSGD